MRVKSGTGYEIATQICQEVRETITHADGVTPVEVSVGVGETPLSAQQGMERSKKKGLRGGVPSDPDISKRQRIIQEKTQKAMAERVGVKGDCPGSHRLNFCEITYRSTGCKACGKMMKPGSDAYACAKCNYAECE